MKSHTKRERSTVAAIVFVGLLIPLGYLLWWLSETSSTAILDFESAHEELASELTPLAHQSFAPGTGTNTNRQVLYSILEQILTAPVSDQDRLTLASQGLPLVQIAHADIQALQTLHAELETDLTNLSLLIPQIRRPSDVTHAEALLAHSQTTLDLIDTILLAHESMNTQSGTILRRIFDDEGALTDSHKRSINESTIEAENNFNTLSESYHTLTKHLEILPY
jgi:hypothetical protein